MQMDSYKSLRHLMQALDRICDFIVDSLRDAVAVSICQATWVPSLSLVRAFLASLI